MFDRIAALTLAIALLGPAPALFAEEVELEYQGLTLNGNLEQVEGNWPQGPLLLMTHGTLAHNQMEIMATLQQLFAERGLSSLAITLSLGLDDREGMYDCATPHRHRHADALGEIGAWLHWLKEQGAERVALLGHSRGGSQTARFAADTNDPAITAVVLIAPQVWADGYAAADYEKRYQTDLAPLLAQAQAKIDAGEPDAMLGPIDFIYCEDTQASAAAFVSYNSDDPRMDSPSLIPSIQAPVLVIAGSADTVVEGLVERTEPLAGGERVQLLVIDGADHFFRDLYAEEVADAVEELLAD
jgi:pimeloyl-ACP methyl ester carboxylesterase